MPYWLHEKDKPATDGESFDTKDEAIQKLNGRTHIITFRPSSEQTRQWRRRECSRFGTGEYIPVPWHDYDDHSRHPHLSVKKPGLVAFTKDEEHGCLDRQTAMRPGRYLQTYLPHYKSHWPEWIAACASEFLTLKIAKTADDIERVYMGGPESCMGRKPLRVFGVKEHPVRVYGDSDLAIAYYGDIDAAAARAICWPEKKIFGRLYGNQGVLQSLLLADGWTSGSTEGAKIRAIKTSRKSYLMPYVDGPEYATLSKNGKWFTLGDEGDYGTQYPTGSTNEDLRRCDNCEQVYDSSEEGEDGCCDNCTDPSSWTCASCGDGMNDDATQYEVYDGMWCRSCWNNEASECAVSDCGERFTEAQFSPARRRDRRAKHLTELCGLCEQHHVYCPTHEDVYDLYEHSTCPQCPEAEKEEVQTACAT